MCITCVSRDHMTFANLYQPTTCTPSADFCVKIRKMEKEGAGEGGDGSTAEREPWFGKEETKGIKKGCSPGRVINGFIAFNFFLVFLTAIIVSGSLGVLNSEVCITKFFTCYHYSACSTMQAT